MILVRIMMVASYTLRDGIQYGLSFGVILASIGYVLVSMGQEQRAHLFYKIYFTTLSLTKNGQLQMAVDAEDFAGAKTALCRGANPNIQDCEGWTCLMKAGQWAKPHSYEIAKTLLD